jgi:4-methyl-5(b-hydroxyethyl)-thiazole monophosphate biosynthesis
MNGYVVHYPGCILAEVEPVISLLSESLKRIELSDVSEELDADYIVVPGGDCEKAVHHAGLLGLIRKIHGEDGLVAGICNGVLVLAVAGILKGKRCTHTAHPKYAPLPEFKDLLEYASVIFKDSIYMDQEVVVDGNIISAKPSAAESFAQTVLEHVTAR